MNSITENRSKGMLPHLQRLFSRNQDSPGGKEHELFMAIFQSALDAYIIYDKATLEIIDTNKQVTSLFELSPEKNLSGLYLSQIMLRYLAPESPNLEFLMNSVSEPWIGEADFLTETKKKVYGIVNTNILSASDCESGYQVMSIRDITEIKEARNEVKKSKISVEKAATSKARFLSSMSHELRTPLNGIIGTSHLILSEANLKEEIKDHINVIRYSSEHMLNIINDILDFSKIDARKMDLKEQAFSIINCLNDVTSSFTHQYKSHNIGLNTNFPEEVLKNINVLSDQMKLSQVINNLLSNALKFTIDGNVELNVKIKETTDTHIALNFEVKDTGIGIHKEKQEEIFQAFSQVHSSELKRKYGGTGLGLTISQQLVKMLGGTLEVESELDKGSRFYFTLQFRIASVATASLKESNHSTVPELVHDIRGLRVLIVEDNEINANILKSFLRKWQMQIKVAITGVHALELTKYHKFDLILMDLEMPEMNGYTALKKIRERNITIPVFAFTATLLENMDSLVKEAGFTDYVLKPFRPSELKMKIEKYCERKIDYA